MGPGLEARYFIIASKPRSNAPLGFTVTTRRPASHVLDSYPFRTTRLAKDRSICPDRTQHCYMGRMHGEVVFNYLGKRSGGQ